MIELSEIDALLVALAICTIFGALVLIVDVAWGRYLERKGIRRYD
jgi:hypothetical protein